MTKKYYNTYTIQDKIKIVEEFISLNKTTQISMREYSTIKRISHQTISNWMKQLPQFQETPYKPKRRNLPKKIKNKK